VPTPQRARHKLQLVDPLGLTDASSSVVAGGHELRTAAGEVIGPAG
jgi:hypothetical protein